MFNPNYRPVTYKIGNSPSGAFAGGSTYSPQQQLPMQMQGEGECSCRIRRRCQAAVR